jgi:NTE family protein
VALAVEKQIHYDVLYPVARPNRLPAKGISMRFLVLAVSFFYLAGCAAIYRPTNSVVAEEDLSPQQGYRKTAADRKPVGDYNVILAFSGGGTRAAALSYGIMKELRSTHVGDQSVSLLEEVDTISSVSGGSFTSAYYGLYGDKLFTDFEQDFLKQSIQSTLVRRLFSPGYWLKSMFTAFDRTELAIEHYNRTLFHGATYADIDLSDKPFIEINSTDLNGGRRFSFVQGNFDLICSDLNEFEVARAVTASSAVPLLFPTVVLKNHADQCDIKNTAFGRAQAVEEFNSERLRNLVDESKVYREVEKKPYVHLVDGGISDNLGLRAVLDELIFVAGTDSELMRKRLGVKTLVILVNASVQNDTTIDQSARKPSVAQTVGAISDVGIAKYSYETIQLVHRAIERIEEMAEVEGIDTSIHLVQIDFESIRAEKVNRFFNNLPTSLELDGDEVDIIVEAGRILLRSSPEFVQFLQENNGELKRYEDDDPCAGSLEPDCISNRWQEIFSD